MVTPAYKIKNLFFIKLDYKLALKALAVKRGVNYLM
jgi:hypothetical protein